MHYYISIHAPRAGRDVPQSGTSTVCSHFNPRAPCGARRIAATVATPISIFQSTRPVRGATQSKYPGCSVLTNFNPRAPCGARLFLLFLMMGII